MKRKIENLNAEELGRVQRAAAGEPLGARLLWSVDEVAQMLGCSPWTIRKWEYEGKLKAVRLGGLVRFEREAVESFIAAARG